MVQGGVGRKHFLGVGARTGMRWMHGCGGPAMAEVGGARRAWFNSGMDVADEPLAALRAATGAAHARLDAGLDVAGRLADPVARTALLAGYKCFFGSVEAAAAPFADALPGLDFARRRRAGRIDAPALPLRALPVGDAAAALGALYVMEGATLGGRVILRGLAVDAATRARLGFLDPYGAASGAMWRRFCEILTAVVPTRPDGLAAAVAAAVATFGVAETCLAPRATRRA